MISAADAVFPLTTRHWEAGESAFGRGIINGFSRAPLTVTILPLSTTGQLGRRLHRADLRIVSQIKNQRLHPARIQIVERVPHFLAL